MVRRNAQVLIQARRAKRTKKLNLLAGASKRTKVAQQLKKQGVTSEISFESLTVESKTQPIKIKPTALKIKKRKKPTKKGKIKAKIARRVEIPKERTIPLDVEVTSAQSVRGTFEAGTFRTQVSEIIHFFEYDIVTQQLTVQLTAAGNWLWYTYQNVSPQTALYFENAPSKGQYYNAVIKKHKFLRGNTIRGFKTINEI